MVERDDRSAVATFFVPDGFTSGGTATLDEAQAHHARVRRLEAGDVVRLTDGAGTLGSGAVVAIRKASVEVSVIDARQVDRPPPIYLFVPVADRERMLWLAEKATELGVARWRPVRFRRSASVSPRGEGEPFAAKVRARMIAALEQSGGAWLPDILTESTLDGVAADAVGERIMLDVHGTPLRGAGQREVSLLLGPEGGLDADERTRLAREGWRAARLAPTILRFETAGIAAIAVLRAATLSE